MCETHPGFFSLSLPAEILLFFLLSLSPQLSGQRLRIANFTVVPSVSLVQLGHTNRNVSLSHESQCGIALVLALSRLEVGEQEKAFVSQGL